jgi:DNA-directed RNA polymerase specialized sigma24 family protein
MAARMSWDVLQYTPVDNQVMVDGHKHVTLLSFVVKLMATKSSVVPDVIESSYVYAATNFSVSPSERFHLWLCSIAVKLVHLIASRERALVVDSGEFQTAVLAAVNTLPNALRTAIVLRDMAGLTYQEIAEVMHAQVEQISAFLAQARCAIDEHVKALLGAEHKMSINDALLSAAFDEESSDGCTAPALLACRSDDPDSLAFWQRLGLIRQALQSDLTVRVAKNDNRIDPKLTFPCENSVAQSGLDACR